MIDLSHLGFLGILFIILIILLYNKNTSKPSTITSSSSNITTTTPTTTITPSSSNITTTTPTTSTTTLSTTTPTTSTTTPTTSTTTLSTTSTTTTNMPISPLLSLITPLNTIELYSNNYYNGARQQIVINNKENLVAGYNYCNLQMIKVQSIRFRMNSFNIKIYLITKSQMFNPMNINNMIAGRAPNPGTLILSDSPIINIDDLYYVAFAII